MSAPVEAQSLSGLTNLFANPPHYPRNPTHQVHEPLVLYIVRVPGSKDVFLSPLKPPTKASISLEAIQSSLYYLHVQTEEDEQVTKSFEEQRRSEDSSRPSVTIARKPVPPTPHPLPPPPEEPAREYQAYQPYRPDAGRAEQGTNLRLNTDLPTGLHQQPAAPGVPYRASGDYALPPTIDENRHLQTPRNFVSSIPAAGVRGTSPPSSYQTSALRQHDPAPAIQALRPTHPKFKPITIIRRDPASASQWNIGTITFLESTFSGSNVKPFVVELTTPGYGRFNQGAGFDSPGPGSAGSDATSIKKALESMTISPVSGVSHDTPLSFSRLVDFRRMALSDLRRTVYQRTNSADSIGKMEPSKPGLEKNVLAFDSPWHGQCTFVNGIDGNSLKIKHTIKSNSSAADGITANLAELRFNLGWSILSNIKDARNRRKDPEPDKLPIPKLIESKKENFRKSLQHLKNKSRESFQRGRSRESDDTLSDLTNIQTPTTNNLDAPMIHAPEGDGHNDYPRAMSSAHPTSSEDNDDDHHRISLKLGREKAGGGFRGHSAKLGKLIIEDEGLKMCDLVVGAAMGIWWQHYEG